LHGCLQLTLSLLALLARSADPPERFLVFDPEQFLKGTLKALTASDSAGFGAYKNVVTSPERKSKRIRKWQINSTQISS
jgi:hypothetical protein